MVRIDVKIKGITGIHDYVTVKKHCTTKFARKSEMSTKENSRFTELTDRFITKKKKLCLLFAKSRAPRQDDGAFEETTRSHLAWPTDDRNLTDFLVI